MQFFVIIFVKNILQKLIVLINYKSVCYVKIIYYLCKIFCLIFKGKNDDLSR